MKVFFAIIAEKQLITVRATRVIVRISGLMHLSVPNAASLVQMEEIMMEHVHIVIVKIIGPKIAIVIHVV